MHVKLDHLVYCVPHLATAIKALNDNLGVMPVIGGQHPEMQTHNALLRLSDDSYLEILALDPSLPKTSKSSWMGIDHLQAPKITRWCLSSDRIKEQVAILKSYHVKMGEQFKGERLRPNGQRLAWDMTLPLADPEVEPIPFLIDWSKSKQHPAQDLKEGCQLTQMTIFHPDPDYIRLILKVLKMDIKVSPGPTAKIEAHISGPKGSIIL